MPSRPVGSRACRLDGSPPLYYHPIGTPWHLGDSPSYRRGDRLLPLCPLAQYTTLTEFSFSITPPCWCFHIGLLARNRFCRTNEERVQRTKVKSMEPKNQGSDEGVPRIPDLRDLGRNGLKSASPIAFLPSLRTEHNACGMPVGAGLARNAATLPTHSR